MNISLEIVIVLYQCSLDESITFRTLNKQLGKTTIDYELVLYNNDINQKIEEAGCLIVNSEENKKLEGAYNFALERAFETGKSWILLLDQDTEIPDNYFKELEKLFSDNYSPDLVAVVPKLISEGKIISPVQVTHLMRFEHEININGYTNKRINALNSLSLLNVEFIKSIGGFSKDFPFDLHDHWCYNKIYKNKKKVYILDIATEHSSSFNNFEENVSVSRYKEFLSTEDRFIRSEIGLPVYFFYKIKLLLRSIKQLINYKNKEFSLVTLAAVFKWSH